MLLPGDAPPRRDPTPDDFHSGDRKRRRKALSCYECRRRKLRCDREYPSCGRCVAQDQTCNYESGSIETDSAPPSNPKPRSKPRVEPPKVEGLAAAAPSIPPLDGVVSHNRDRSEDFPIPDTVVPAGSWQSFGEMAPVATSDPLRRGANSSTLGSETVYFMGANFTTQYYGGTNPTSQISHFPELRWFMKGAMSQHTSLPRVQRDVKASQKRWKNEAAEALHVSDSELMSLFPDRETADELCRFYFENFENAYRILHGPAFWKDYKAFWENPKGAESAFVVTVLLVMATVNCMASKKRPTYIGDSSLARETAVVWIQVSEEWAERQSQKHAHLALWQIRCLLIVATLSNTVKKKRAWTSAGTLLRQAMSAGFHRDPILLRTKISVFDQEMRRRLWATIVELELQTSIDRGMPSGSAGLPCDSASPMNIDDEELAESLEHPPKPKPADKFTPCSYLYLSAKSLSLRGRLNSYLNGPNPHMSHEDVLLYDDQINQKLQELPLWTSTNVGPEGSQQMDVPGALLEIQLRQFILMIHGAYARRTEANARNSMSKIACFNAAGRILELHSALVAAGNFTLALLRHDVFRSAVLLCHYVHVSNRINNDIALQKLRVDFSEYISGAMNVLDERITRLGTGYTHYWYVSAASSLVQCKASLGNYATQKKQAIDRVLMQYFKVLAAQEDMSKLKEKVPFSRVLKTMPLITAMPTIDELLGNDYTQVSEPTDAEWLDASLRELTGDKLGNEIAGVQYPEYYFGDPAAWVFDDVPSFDPMMQMPGL